MTEIPSELQEAAKQVTARTPYAVTARVLLSWFGVSRRGANVVDRINRALHAVGLESKPHFADVWIDQPVALVLADGVAGKTSDTFEINSPVVLDVETHETPASPPLTVDAQALVLSIGALDEANTSAASVTPDASINEAISRLRLGAHPVLAVLDGSGRQPRGALTWRELVLALQSEPPPRTVAELLRRWPAETSIDVLRADADIFQITRQVFSRGFAFVRGAEGRVCGPVTAAMLGELFAGKLEPYVLAGEVEHTLRLRVAAVASELAENLTIGECQRYLQRADIWARVGFRIDRSVFDQHLDEVRTIRNDLMHFNPDRFDEKAIAVLRRFVVFLRDEARGVRSGAA